MWDLPWPRIKPVSPALAGGFFTTEPPGKPSWACFKGFHFLDNSEARSSSENGHWEEALEIFREKRKCEMVLESGRWEWLPGSPENLFVVCGHEFQVRPLSTVVWFVISHIFMWVHAGGGWRVSLNQRCTFARKKQQQQRGNWGCKGGSGCNWLWNLSQIWRKKRHGRVKGSENVLELMDWKSKS